MKTNYDVYGMTCSACSSRVEKTVAKLEGVNAVSVNLLTNSMVIDTDENKLSSDTIIKAIEDAGYGAQVKSARGKTNNNKDSNSAESVAEKIERAMKSRVIWSFAFLVPLMYIAMGHMIQLPLPSFLNGEDNSVAYAFTQFILCLPVLYINRSYYTKGFKTLSHGAPNMDTLIALGSSASMIYGIFAIYRLIYGIASSNMELVHRYYHDLYFESAVMILALINLGKYFEAISKGKTSTAITKLMNLAPKTAFAERDGDIVEIPSEEVIEGDVLQIKPGMSIPVDGVIIEGSTGIDEAAITGESIPVEKSVGDTVIAATMNKNGFFRMRATKVGDDTTIAKIIKLVEEASASKAPIAKMADKVAGVFVPIVMVISIITALAWIIIGAEFEFALSSAIAVLVISCPCALGLATPVAIMVGTGKAAENGIIIKSGEALEILHSINCVVLDKTGTVTEGNTKVTGITTYDISEENLIKIAASIEKGSEHPLADAIIQKSTDYGINNYIAHSYKITPGYGIEAVIDNTIYYAGNIKLADKLGLKKDLFIDDINIYTKSGKTPVIISDSEKVLGIIAISDTIKKTSAAAIAMLKNMNIEVIMLTGDNKNTANAIKEQVGIDRVVADVLPQDKEKEIRKLHEAGKKVAMVGDGINDAPALASADVGIAIGTGTDVAIESADVILMKSDLLDVVTAINLSKKVITNIKQNLFWAFFYNVCGIPLAAGLFYPAFGVKLSPMIGAAAMSMSSLFVVSNALRLRFFSVIKSESENYIIKEENKYMYTVKIEGMMCAHCQATVNKALNNIAGITAQVNLEKNEAYIQSESPINQEIIKKSIIDAGYTVTSISQTM